MRYLLHSMRLMLLCATQYRLSFLLQSAGQLVMTCGDLMAVLVLMDRFAHLGSWTGAQVLFFFGVMQISFALTECFGRGVTTFPKLVASGDLDALMLRPRPLLLQVICAQLDPRRFATVAVGALALGVAGAQLSISWTPAKAALLLLCIAGSVLLLLALFLVEATVSLFSVRSIEMINVLTFGGRQTCQYPVDVYPGPIRTLFTWVVPFALCMHLPVSLLLDRPIFDVPVWCAYLAPLTGAAFFLLSARAWYLGMRHYRSTGS